LTMSKAAVFILVPLPMTLAPPLISKAPASAIVPAKLLLKPVKSIVPDLMRIAPVSATAASMMLVPVPAVFSRDGAGGIVKARTDGDADGDAVVVRELVGSAFLVNEVTALRVLLPSCKAPISPTTPEFSQMSLPKTKLFTVVVLPCRVTSTPLPSSSAEFCSVSVLDRVNVTPARSSVALFAA